MVTGALLWASVFSALAKELTQLHFQGLPQEMEENVRANLVPWDNDEDGSERQLEYYQHQAEKDILLTLQAYGYYNATLKSQFQIQEGQWHGNFDIHLGPPTRITSLHFALIGQAREDASFNAIYRDFPLKKGDIFEHDRYEQGKKDILAKVIEKGYLNAVFSTHRVEVDPDNNTCEIFLTLDSGSLHYFGLVSFNDTKLSPHFLQRYVPFKTGEVYSPEKILSLQSDLNQSNYFSQVNVKPLETDHNTTVPVVVELEDAKPNQYVLGAGFGTDTGIRGKLGWTRRQINSYGHRFSAQAQIAEVYEKAQIEYSIPGHHPSTDQLKFTGGYFDDEFSEKPSRILETAVVQERAFHHGWQSKLSLAYHHERFIQFETNETIQSKLILPSLTLIHIKRDDPLTPTKGSRLELTVRGSIDALISDTSFLQSYLQWKWLRALDENTKVLVRTELGFTAPDDSERLPLSQRFFAGGDLSLRGYGYRTLPSEIDKNGVFHPVGGAYLAIGSIELARVIKKPFGVFTFLDAGNAFRREDNEIAMGTGLGVEWLTRLGPIKFAIAKPLTKSADSWRIHANFGPEL